MITVVEAKRIGNERHTGRMSTEVHLLIYAGPKPMGGLGGGALLQETICRKILLSCRKFCDLND